VSAATVLSITSELVWVKVVGSAAAYVPPLPPETCLGDRIYANPLYLAPERINRHEPKIWAKNYIIFIIFILLNKWSLDCLNSSH
jgi:hypothetical protein